MAHDILVDGKRYVPEDASNPRIGIGVTTHNRLDTFRKTYEEIVRHSPGCKIVVVDDASATPIADADYRFETNAGIARAKNKCLELLQDCEHIFLFDDDAYPLVDDWWRPYADSPEPHLMRIFEDLAGPQKLRDISVLYRDGRHVAYSGSRGVMLYVHRSVLDVVGGMDPAFGRWGYEHPDYSNRIHAAGLTTWRYADVVDSDRLIYSLDEYSKADRSVDGRTRNALVRINKEIHDAQFDTPKYCEYREQRDVVITSLFTAQADPQRGSKMEASSTLLAELRASLAGHDFVVLHNALTDVDGNGTAFIHCEQFVQPYFQRWISTWQYLRDHPEIRYVWAVDGTDVVMLQDPFPNMSPGKLYLGTEPQIVGCDWMVQNHKAKILADFFATNRDKTLLNCGLIGGDRSTVMELLHHMIRLFFDNQREIFHHEESESLGVGDMGALNYVGYTYFADRLVIGPRINTVFKAFEKNNTTAFWRHK